VPEPYWLVYAEYVALPAENVGVFPEYLDVKQAGALPISGLTVHQGIAGTLHLKKGETIIILGASGAVGSVAVQLAKSLGARVLAVASGKDGVALVRRLGADLVVDGRAVDAAAAARKFAPDGADALLALAGGKSLTTFLDAVAKDGRAYPTAWNPRPKNAAQKSSPTTARAARVNSRP
jgi:NADPH:quinone reductase